MKKKHPITDGLYKQCNHFSLLFSDGLNRFSVEFGEWKELCSFLQSNPTHILIRLGAKAFVNCKDMFGIKPKEETTFGDVVKARSKHIELVK